ncbi:UNVERIFIED_CONTAM: Retrovirus-related Pol polyprotein from transposon TNT 1-94 [Sesamum calycinum]|uniref:Retrovirus-related Pol polyprotein from transposon TNT 1-94 n=1 Tax=Sesamum calycinum TaxID=2727403 RepID=A0AAW2L6P2_9LAMI
MHNANPVVTPMDKSCVLSKELCPKTEEEKKRIAKISYASTVGSLMYAMMCTRPDLCLAVGIVSRDECKSTPGYTFLFGGAAITWCSKKQPCISLSTMEAEYIACTSATQEANCHGSIFKGPQVPRRIKHIDTRYHFIRDSIIQGEMVLRHITNDMIADRFTKPLRKDAFHRHMYEMSLGLYWPSTRAIALAL